MIMEPVIVTQARAPVILPGGAVRIANALRLQEFVKMEETCFVLQGNAIALAAGKETCVKTVYVSILIALLMEAAVVSLRVSAHVQ